MSAQVAGSRLSAPGFGRQIRAAAVRSAGEVVAEHGVYDRGSGTTLAGIRVLCLAARASGKGLQATLSVEEHRIEEHCVEEHCVKEHQ
jgi:hypothetical protein